MAWFQRTTTGKPDPADPSDPDACGRLWLAQTAAGSRAALGKLVKAYGGAFKRDLCRGGLSLGDAEDTLQDFWLTIAKDAGRYRPQQASPVAWLKTVLRNQRVDALRKASRQSRGRAPYHADEDEDGGEHGLRWDVEKAMAKLSPQPEERRMHADFEDCLRDAWARLKRQAPQRMEVLHSFAMERLTLAELAARFGIGQPTLDNYLRQARQIWDLLIEPCLDLKRS